MNPRVDEALDLAEKINDVIVANTIDQETDVEDVAASLILALAMIMVHSGMGEAEGTTYVRKALPHAFQAARSAKRAIN
jgi:hypothetical protein